MKKTLLFFTSIFASQLAGAQTLTRAHNEPVPGDVHTVAIYDTVTTLPRNTGAGQHWDFSSLVLDETTSTFFSAASSVSSHTLFSGATLAEQDTANGSYTFYKSATTPTTQLEMLGFYSDGQPAAYVNYTNSIIPLIWPVSFGSTHNDSYSGSLNVGIPGYSGNSVGTLTVTATGTGTITMPGGISYPNILQVKTINSNMETLSGPGLSDNFSSISTQYDYYEPSQKFPLLSVIISVEMDDAQSGDTSVTVSANQLITVGIQDRNFFAGYAIYPNPAKDSFSVKLSNASNDLCTISIFNITGQQVKTISLGKGSAINEKISLSGLTSGVYIVKTTLGNNQSSRRLVIE